MEEADAYYKDIIEKSNGKFKESRIDLKVKGVFTAQFTTCWNVWLSEMLYQLPKVKCLVFIDIVVPTHPEHYAHLKNQEGLVETTGEHPARVFVHPCANTPEFVKDYGDPSYQNLPAMGALKDGNTFVYIFQDLWDSNEDCNYRLRCFFPAAAPQVLFDEHAEHLAVEFRGSITSTFEWNQRQSNPE